VRALVVMLALAPSVQAHANPCRLQSRLRAQAELGASLPMPNSTPVRLSDSSYDPGYLLAGARVAVAARPFSCFELGIAARHARIDEGRARDGAVLRSEGNTAAGLFGFRLRLRDDIELAMLFEVGAMDTTQTLRGARLDGRSIGFAGRDELVLGRGATALVVAFDITAYVFEPTMAGDIEPRLAGLGMYLGVTHRR
jgi:hypothetical protein